MDNLAPEIGRRNPTVPRFEARLEEDATIGLRLRIGSTFGQLGNTPYRRWPPSPRNHFSCRSLLDRRRIDLGDGKEGGLYPRSNTAPKASVVAGAHRYLRFVRFSFFSIPSWPVPALLQLPFHCLH